MFANILKSHVKIVTCIFLVFCLSLFTLSGCDHKGEAVAQYENYKMEASEYNYILVQQIYNAPAQLTTSLDSQAQSSNLSQMISEGQIDNKPAAEYLKEQATKISKVILATRIECDKLGINLSDDDKNKIKENVEKSYDQLDKAYNVSKLGITKESTIQFYEDYQRVNLLSNEHFGDGKSQSIPDEQVDEYTKNHGLKYKIVPIFKPATANDESVAKVLKNEDVKDVKALVDKYMSQIAANKSIDDINAAYNKASEEKESALDYTFQYDDQDFEEKEFVLSIKPNSPATLKEDELAYYIIQRLEVDQETIEKERNTSRSVLLGQSAEKFFIELSEKYDIKVNQAAIDSHDPVDLAVVLQSEPASDQSSSSNSNNNSDNSSNQ